MFAFAVYSNLWKIHFFQVANDTINFTGADIARLCKKVFESNNLSTPLPANKPCTNLDFESAMNSF